MKVYDECKYANASYDDIVSSCALGCIPFSEINEFSNREKYMCLIADAYCNYYKENLKRYDEVLRAMVTEFGSTGEDGILDSRGSESMERAFELLKCKNGDSSSHAWWIYD